MNRSIATRTFLAIAVSFASCALTGCDSGSNTKMPTNTPPIPNDAQGKPVPPPTAAGGAPSK